MRGRALASRRERPKDQPLEKKVSANVIRAASYLLVLLPVALGFAYVHLFGVDVPHYDSWSMVPFFEKLSSGTLTVRDLFAQHNEHRIFFPRIAMLSLGTVTAFNNVAIMYLIQLCLLATSIALLLAFKSNIRANLLYFAPIPFLVFTWGQIWNLLQAFQITLVFAQTFGVLTFYLLYLSGNERLRYLSFPGALGSGTVASFSAAPGLLVWPVGLLQLLILPARGSLKSLLAGAWGLVGVAEWAVYFHNYVQPKNTSSRYISDHLLTSVEYFLTTLGASLFRQQGFALVVGLLLACLVAASLFFVYESGKLGECSFWIAILSFSFLVLASTTVARGGSGIEDALIPKYVTFSVLAVISAYAMLVRSTFEQRKPAIAISLGVLTTLVVSSIPVSYVEGLNKGKRLERAKEQAAFVLATYESQPDEVLKKFFRKDPEISRVRASTLETLGYSVFSEPRPRVLPPPLSTLSPARSRTLSNIQTIAGVGSSPQDEPVVIPEGTSSVRVAGWAVDAEAKDTAGGVYVVVDGKPFPAFYRTRKEEVAERLEVPEYEYSGFWRAIRLSEVGAHELSVIVVTNDEKRYYRPEDRQRNLCP
jgi:hypothetical protein